MPTPLPADTDFTQATNQAGAKVAYAEQRAFLAEQLGVNGENPVGHFRPYANSPADMTIKIAAGGIQNGITPNARAIQQTVAFVAPATNPRHDLVVISQSDGALSVVAGTEAANPVDPAIPSNKIAVGRVRLTGGMTSITDANIDNLRPLYFVSLDLLTLLATANLWGAQQRPKYGNAATAAGGGSFTFDPTTHGQIALITCSTAGTLTFNAPTNIVEGAPYTMMLKAGDANARTPAWSAAFKWGGATSPITALSTTVGTIDMVNFIGGAANTLIYNGHKQDVR